MSRFFLLSSNITIEPYPVYPIGMAIIASALESDGHTVCQFDFLAGGKSESALLSELLRFKADYIGVSIRNIDNVDSLSTENNWYLQQVRDLIKLVRNKISVPIIVGGPAFSIMPEAILEYIGADYGIVGEGEHSICELIKSLNKSEPVPQIIRNDNYLSEDRISLPLMKKELVRFYMDNSGMINYQTKRGCPQNCLYCTYPSLEGNRFRCYDPGEIVSHIKKIKKEYNSDSFFFTDSVFNDAAGHYLEFAEELIRQEVGIRWAGFFRPQGMAPDDLKLLKQSGLYAAESGTDAASDTTLSGLNKGFTFDDVLAFNQICNEENIPLAHFIIFGGPGETPDTVNEGLRNIKTLEKSVVFAFSGIRILPGTELYKIALKEKILSEKDSLLKPIYYFSSRIDPKNMNKTIEVDFSKRKDRVFPPYENNKIVRSLNLFGINGLLWDLLLTDRPDRKRRKRIAGN